MTTSVEGLYRKVKTEMNIKKRAKEVVLLLAMPGGGAGVLFADTPVTPPASNITTSVPSDLSLQLPSTQPNIVFIMADDLGPGWVDFTGERPEIKTPNLRRMAKAGMVFTKAYAADPVCSPTRAACITGMSSAQIGLTIHIPGRSEESYLEVVGGLGKAKKSGDPDAAVDAESKLFLPLNGPGYARELKKLGYGTAFIGKWHLAGAGSMSTKDGVVNSAWHPEHYGFDSNLGGCAYGQPKSWFDPYGNGTIPNRRKGEYLTDRLGDEAAAFIKAKHDGPFHLSFWPYSVHHPLRAPKERVAANGGDAYRAMLESLDLSVGKVLDALKETGVMSNTLVVFCSDNGGEVPTKGLAEKKGSLMEGGLRVPMVVVWPGVVRGGTTCDVPVISMDFFPTFIHAAGGSTAEIKQLEGLDLMPLFKEEKTWPRDTLYWHFPHYRNGIKYAMGSSVLTGDWVFYQGYADTPDALFNLKNDPLEKNNLFAGNPELADRLRGKLNRWLRQVSAKMPRNAADFSN